MIVGIVSRGAMPRFERALIVLMLVLLALFVERARAEGGAWWEGVRFESAVGNCRFTQSEPGTWWQPDHEHSNDYKDRCGEVGLSMPVSLFGSEFRVHGRFVTLGRAHTRALARTFPGDDARLSDPYADVRRAECDDGFSNDCLYFWTGDGGVKGLNFSMSRELFRVGLMRMEGELGALVYRIKWNNQVYPLNCHDTECAWRITVNQKSKGVHVAPMVGLTALFELSHEHKLDLYVGFRYYFNVGDRIPVTAGVKGPVEQWTAGIAKTF